MPLVYCVPKLGPIRPKKPEAENRGRQRLKNLRSRPPEISSGNPTSYSLPRVSDEYTFKKMHRLAPILVEKIQNVLLRTGSFRVTLSQSDVPPCDTEDM